MPTRAKSRYDEVIREPVSLRTRQRQAAAGVEPAVPPAHDEVIARERMRIARALMGEGYLGMSGT